MGGFPWKVVPREARSLIIGIGQSHKLVSKKIERYFAYCVLTESSGLYKDLRVLGSGAQEDIYLTQFAENLTSVLHGYSDDFDSFVIHSSFTLRRKNLIPFRLYFTVMLKKIQVRNLSQ